MLGEDNDRVYREIIGLTDSEIAGLKKNGVLGDLEYDWAGPMPDFITGELDPGIIVV